MIINIPIEPIPMRYSVDWYNWFNSFFNKKGIPFKNICGHELTKGIESGQFLDCIGTNYYKSSQLMMICEAIYKKEIKSGDVLFFHDLWFPGIEQIKYICDTMKIKLKIMGCLHAGAYDPNDFLYKSNTGNWSVHFENMLFSLVDRIFVATNYHRDLILKGRSVNPEKIKVTCFPFIPKKNPGRAKQNIVVFPHRLAPEKNPEVFKEIEKYFKKEFWEWDFVTTTEHCKTKEAYYTLLETSKICISLSEQETWGIAMQEAAIAGCIPFVPDKLSYSEMYYSPFKYSNLFDLLDKLFSIMNNYQLFRMKNIDSILKQNVLFEEKGRESFENITKELLS